MSRLRTGDLAALASAVAKAAASFGPLEESEPLQTDDLGHVRLEHSAIRRADRVRAGRPICEERAPPRAESDPAAGAASRFFGRGGADRAKTSHCRLSALAQLA